MENHNPPIYSEAASPEEARKLLANLSENRFLNDAGDRANALGRGTGEILDILNHDEEVDKDLFINFFIVVAREFDL